MRLYWIAIFITLPCLISFEHFHWLIIWDVGQGQWVTIIDGNNCYHFDTGGERWPKKAISSFCKQRNNRAMFSHNDWDHISFKSKVKWLLPKWCEANPALPGCLPKNLFHLNPCDRSLTGNEGSHIFQWNRKILIAGDSIKKMERRWSKKVSPLIWFLIAGHHGSNTSTSQPLIERLTNLRQAFSSSRKKRYGHPHPKVKMRLRRAGVPLISTENWGNIAVLLEPVAANERQQKPYSQCF